MRSPHFLPTILITGLMALSAGCIPFQSQTHAMEQRLGAAGFRLFYPQNDAEKVRLQSMPQHQLLKTTTEGQPHYLYADDKDCQCLYVGQEPAYQTLQTLTAMQKSADAQLKAAEYRESIILGPRNSGLPGDYGAGGYW